MTKKRFSPPQPTRIADLFLSILFSGHLKCFDVPAKTSRFELKNSLRKEGGIWGQSIFMVSQCFWSAKRK
jgi:hypothetical protein